MRACLPRGQPARGSRGNGGPAHRRAPGAGAPRPVLLAVPLLLAADAGQAQFQLLRFDDAFAVQGQACSEAAALACWKDRALEGGHRLSLGGELRWRYEYTGHPGYGRDPDPIRSVWMQRYSAFADLRVGTRLRGFAQLSGARIDGRMGEPATVDANRLDPSNLFVEWSTDDGHAPGTGVRAGIQELRFGSGRLIDVREGPNVRRSFEGLRAWHSAGRWRIDALAVAPRDPRPGRFDDVRSSTRSLRMIHATRRGEATDWDLYALHHEDTAARDAGGLVHERRWTLGARASGRLHAWDWNWEAAVQGGRSGEAAIRAWTLATDTGYTLDLRWRPRIALLSAIASGDRDSSDRRMGAFDALYPRGNYFGDEATLGPRNFYNLHPAISLQPAPAVELTASLDLYWRYSLADGVYAPNGNLLQGPGASRARHVATIASFSAVWTPSPAWSASLDLAHARPGEFLRDSGLAQTLRQAGLTLRYRF